MGGLQRRSFLTLGAATALLTGAKARAMTVLRVDPPSALQDMPLRIRAEGFDAGERVTITADMTGRSNVPWRAWATFAAGPDGAIDVGATAPVDGTYAGVSAMGLVWSMVRAGDAPPGATPQPLRTPVTIAFHARGENGATASATAQRLLLGPGVTFQALDQDGLKGGWHLPPGTGSHPVVIVL